MTISKGTVLIIDDEPLNLEILTEYIECEGFDILSAENGAQAISLFESNRDKIETIVLDRMMPGMDGLDVLLHLRNKLYDYTTPVIMQTAKASRDDIIEGIKAGANHYLTKPYEKDVLLALLSNCVRDHQLHQELNNYASKKDESIRLLKEARFEFRTLDEAKNLAVLLAKRCTQPEEAVIGLSELLVNAVEHGNLAISYDMKTQLNNNDSWKEEVQRRLNLDEYKDRKVTVNFQAKSGDLYFEISDEGEGFDWQAYMNPDPDRAFDNHGNGLMLASNISFSQLNYNDKGNVVTAVIRSELM